jgi:hypothetical protein
MKKYSFRLLRFLNYPYFAINKINTTASKLQTGFVKDLPVERSPVPIQMKKPPPQADGGFGKRNRLLHTIFS